MGFRNGLRTLPCCPLSDVMAFVCQNILLKLMSLPTCILSDDASNMRDCPMHTEQQDFSALTTKLSYSSRTS
jgi:hypothetical protein